MPVKYGSMPFKEAITFFRDKVNVPTKSWTDIWEGMHSRAFVIAGATKDELLTDMRESVTSAIEKGTTLQQFRKDFDQIVQKHGWEYNGGRGWRTRVIYDTNLRQAYSAGREKQMQDPELRKFRPYGRYVHSDSVEHPRPEHLANHDVVLPLDDPFWDIWTPQNGWGCQCKKQMLSDADVERRGLKVLKKAPRIEYEEKTVGVRGPNPRIVRVPKGIDPGFAYNPGTAAWGKQLSDDAMQQWRRSKGKWQPLSFGGPETYNRPENVPLDKPKAKIIAPVKSVDAATASLRKILGGDEKVFDKHGLPVLVNAESLALHVDLNRTSFLPYITEALNNPFEIWLSFERHAASGKVELRARYIKAIKIDKGKGMLVVANAVKGKLEAWTLVPMSQLKGLQKQRRGQLIYGRK